MNKQIVLNFLKSFMNDYIAYTAITSLALVFIAAINTGILLEFLVKMIIFTAIINTVFFLATWFIKKLISIFDKSESN